MPSSSPRTTAASAAPSPRRTSTNANTTAALTTAAAGSTRSQWTKTFSNGDSYHGEALHVHDGDQKPIKDGKGRYTWASSGAVYEGEWRGGRPHGHGVMSVPGKDGYEYTGSFAEGQRSGQGRCRFANGRTYDGEWRADEMNGHGTVHGAPGADDYAEYTGSFELGQRSGAQGRCVYLNGDVYDGAWLAGRRQGMGEWLLHRPSSSVAVSPVRYSGPFDHDAPRAGGSTEASVDYSDGSSYVGAVTAQLRRNGHGVHRLANGDVFDGNFAQDQREGRGVLQGREGTVCEGTWRRGQLEGPVRVTFTTAAGGGGDGETPAAGSGSDVDSLQQLRRSPYSLKSYDGPCTAGVLTGGSATLVYADGSSYRGAVRNGQPHGAGVLRDRPLPHAVGDATGGDGKDGVRRRINTACVPAAASMTLICYEGAFSAGEPDGTGTGEWHVSAASPAPSHQQPVVRATPLNFCDLLAQGISWWPAASYAVVDGTYTGQWLRGLPQGQGKWKWVDGATYAGAVACYLPSGEGTYTTPSLQYTGAFVSGLPEGKGVWEDKTLGLAYEGEWAGGKPSGEGVCTVLTDFTSTGGSYSAARAPPTPTKGTSATHFVFPCTAVYEGTWVDGRPSGHGRTYASPDRQRVVYDGHYVDGRCEGEGTLYFGSVRRGSVNGEAAAAAVHGYAQYSGAFTQGRPGGSGSGCLTLRNNTTVASTFDADLHPCRGATVTVLPHNEAWSFKGTFDAARRVGEGTMTFPNGDVYKGEVEDAAAEEGAAAASAAPLLYSLQRHGKGVYTFVEGNQLQCTWRHNVLHGAGVYTSADGVRTERTYTDGVLSNDIVVSSVGASGGLGSVGAGGSVGNVFTPENEFPNTLSADALKSRMPDAPQNLNQHQQQQQPRKRAPFSFVRRGEARQASTAGAASSASPRAGPTAASDGGNGREPSASRGVRRTPPTTSISPAAAAAAEATQSPKKENAARTPTRGTTAAAAAVGTAPATVTSAPGATTAHKYSLRRHPSSQASSNGSTPPPPSSSTPEGGDNSSGGGGGGTTKRSSTSATSASPPSKSVYLTRFQAGIRQLDNEPPQQRSPSPSMSGASARTSPTASGPARRRLSTALAAGRDQQRQQDGAPLPRQQRQTPVTLEGSLKEMMKEACAIRSSREDEIHLLTEEMRQLNERIWQLRYVIANGDGKTHSSSSGDRGAKKGAGAPNPATPGRRLSKNGGNQGGAERESPASQTQRLAMLIQERRVIMEKLQCVVNDPS